MLHAVVFDIGGVLELTPPTGYRERWEKSLGLAPGNWTAECTRSGGVERSAR
jgi:hypothetical protein